MSKHFYSVFEDETQLLRAILSVHCGGADTFDADPFYFKGNFYKTIHEPDLVYDINPQYDFVKKCDVRDVWMQPGFNNLNSIILDPPFMFGSRKTQKEYYSSKTHTIFETFEKLEECYKNALHSAKVGLKKGGVCVFKCQDFTDSKTTMTHCFVKEWAEEKGFYAKDLAILVKPNKVYNGNLQQRHLRKVHTYFWVFVSQ